MSNACLSIHIALLIKKISKPRIRAPVACVCGSSRRSSFAWKATIKLKQIQLRKTFSQVGLAMKMFQEALLPPHPSPSSSQFLCM